MNGFSDTPGNGENDTTRRKLSSITASSYVDSWRQRLPIDAESSVKGFTSKCSPTMAGVNDIEHQSNQLGQASEEKLSPNLGHKQCSEDLNSNTTSLEDVRIHKKPSVRRNDSYFQKDGLTFHTRNNGTELLKKEDSGTSLKNDLAVGIGGQPVSTERKIPNELNRNARDNITIISVSDKSDANLSKVSEDRHRASKSTESITANSSKCNVTKAKIDTKF